MANDWVKLFGMKIGKIIAGILLALIVIIVIVGVFTNKHIKIGPIEFNEKSEKEVNTTPKNTDTSNVTHVPPIKTDTLNHTSLTIKESSPNQIKNNQTSSSPLVRYSPKGMPSQKQNTSDTVKKFDLKGSIFNGPTQVGDHNTQNNNFEPTISKDQELQIIRDIKKFQRDSGMSNNVIVMVSSLSHPKIISQIADLLNKSGFNVVSFGNTLGVFSGYFFNKCPPEKTIIMMDVGQFK